MRNRTLRIGAQLGIATTDQPTTAAALITVSVDSTFIRSREEGERHLEVRVGNVETASRGCAVYNGTFGSGLGHLFQPHANQNERSVKAA